jgi:2-keto-4-pentenoate hydratase/2-oxohepta-3-ene-1,7-dioic acid hydratase in catechol pathway
LLALMSESFSLMPGDIVLTGTPAGVGPLARGDKLVAKLNDLLVVSTTVS